MVLNFPAGAGGHWLKSVLLNNCPLEQGVANFHKVAADAEKCHQVAASNQSVRLSHDCDIHWSDEYVFSGSCFFNFYLNHIGKHFLNDESKEVITYLNYETKVHKILGLATYLSTYESSKHPLRYFDFDILLDDVSAFHCKVQLLQKKLGLPAINMENFLIARKTFFDTCVNPEPIYENFDNMLWVFFVMDRLSQMNIFPHGSNHFYLDRIENSDLCKQFALQNYQYCPVVKCREFPTQNVLPEVF